MPNRSLRLINVTHLPGVPPLLFCATLSYCSRDIDSHLYMAIIFLINIRLCASWGGRWLLELLRGVCDPPNLARASFCKNDFACRAVLY